MWWSLAFKQINISNNLYYNLARGANAPSDTDGQWGSVAKMLYKILYTQLQSNKPQKQDRYDVSTVKVEHNYLM